MFLYFSYLFGFLLVFVGFCDNSMSYCLLFIITSCYSLFSHLFFLDLMSFRALFLVGWLVVRYIIFRTSYTPYNYKCSDFFRFGFGYFVLLFIIILN